MELSARFPARLRVRGSVVLLQQRISLRLFVGGGICLMLGALLWVAGLALQAVLLLEAACGLALVLMFEVSWAGRPATRWLRLLLRRLVEPRVLRLGQELVALAPEPDGAARPVRWDVRRPSLSPIDPQVVHR